jgi:hypothetical protein
MKIVSSDPTRMFNNVLLDLRYTFSCMQEALLMSYIMIENLISFGVRTNINHITYKSTSLIRICATELIRDELKC